MPLLSYWESFMTSASTRIVNDKVYVIINDSSSEWPELHSDEKSINFKTMKEIIMYLKRKNFDRTYCDL